MDYYPIIAGVFIIILSVVFASNLYSGVEMCHSPLGQVATTFDTDNQQVCSQAEFRLYVCYGGIVAGIILCIVGFVIKK
jgi:hypothetical protein